MRKRKTVKLDPVYDVPVPYKDTPENGGSAMDEFVAAANTAGLQADLGGGGFGAKNEANTDTYIYTDPNPRTPTSETPPEPAPELTSTPLQNCDADVAPDETTQPGNQTPTDMTLGAEVFDGIDDEAVLDEARMLRQFMRSGGKTSGVLNSPGAALAANAFMQAYGGKLAHDVATARQAVMNKLFEIADCGDTRYELKALELLGKTRDIALFSERTEVHVKYDSAGALEDAIRERVKRLLNADLVDVTPVNAHELDEELGRFEEMKHSTDIENPYLNEDKPQPKEDEDITEPNPNQQEDTPDQQENTPDQQENTE